MNLANTNQDVLVEQCIDILHENELSCILTSISNTEYPYAVVIKPVCGLGIDTIYFIISEYEPCVQYFGQNTKGSITYYSGENSVHLTGDVFMISSEAQCQDATDIHLVSNSVPDGSVLVKFATNKSYIHIGKEDYVLQM